MDFLDFFLSAPYFGLDVPHTTLKALKFLPNVALTRRAKLPKLLVRRTNGLADGAVFVFEYVLHGIGTKCYIPADSDGFRTVVAPPSLRREVALEAAGFLLQRGALLMMLSYMEPATGDTRLGDDTEAQLARPAPALAFEHRTVGSRIDSTVPHSSLQRHAHRRLLASQLRVLGRRLPLRASFEETLETLSRNTRHNLRRSMQQASRDLGARFQAEAVIELDALQELSSQSAYGPPDWAVRERFSAATELPGGVLAGMRDESGRWISIVGGHREQEMLCLDWQLNRSGLGALSLATAMRAFLIESEVAQGSLSLRFESGTTHPMQRAFLREHTHDLLFARRVLPVRLLKRLAGGMAEGGPLATALTSSNLVWHR